MVFKKHNPGCPCCNAPCCDGNAPDRFTVTIEFPTDPTCDFCADPFSGTYTLEATGETGNQFCVWHKQICYYDCDETTCPPNLGPSFGAAAAATDAWRIVTLDIWLGISNGHTVQLWMQVGGYYGPYDIDRPVTHIKKWVWPPTTLADCCGTLGGASDPFIAEVEPNPAADPNPAAPSFDVCDDNPTAVLSGDCECLCCDLTGVDELTCTISETIGGTPLGTVTLTRVTECTWANENVSLGAFVCADLSTVILRCSIYLTCPQGGTDCLDYELTVAYNDNCDGPPGFVSNPEVGCACDPFELTFYGTPPGGGNVVVPPDLVSLCGCPEWGDGSNLTMKFVITI